MANVKLSLKAFCSWGDGPDVGVNAYDESGEYADGYDLTADEAIELAGQLIRAAQLAKEMDRSYMEMVQREQADAA